MIVQLTLLIALLATIASAKFNRLPFPELQVQFHPRSHPELCLAAFSTAPRQWTLKLCAESATSLLTSGSAATGSMRATGGGSRTRRRTPGS